MRDIRETVLRSLSAVGATQEARFYAELFAAQEPERFAVIALDHRCLEEPLQDALISNLQILSNLGLIPIILVGAGYTSVLSEGLRDVSVETVTVSLENTSAVEDVRRAVKAGTLPIVRVHARLSDGLEELVSAFNPGKVIFLQPSGGIDSNGERVAVINVDRIDKVLAQSTLSPGQERFIKIAKSLASNKTNTSVYVMASPLNLMAELFTTQGSGTMLRRAASVLTISDLDSVNINALITSMESAFARALKADYLTRPLSKGFIDDQYRGGAILTELAGLPYLSKFWVIQAARGEGIARDIWDVLTEATPAFFWRSRMANPFNDWYMKACDGMQISGDWRVFWIGLNAPEVPSAIIAAASAPEDFE